MSERSSNFKSFKLIDLIPKPFLVGKGCRIPEVCKYNRECLDSQIINDVLCNPE